MKSDRESRRAPKPFRVYVSLFLMIAGFTFSVLGGFFLGLVVRRNAQENVPVLNVTYTGRPGLTLPNPVLKEGKTIPESVYTTKNFASTSASTTASSWVPRDERNQQCTNATTECPALMSKKSERESEEEHLPQGQHLLIDIENVDPLFLNSEEKLATAMISLIDKCGLTMLSYHCHGLEPTGVSCVGILQKSHVSIHTWPNAGVITLDLFTSGPDEDSLIPAVPIIEQLFGLATDLEKTDKSVETPRMVWVHKYRGFTDESTATDEITELIDLFTFPLGLMTDYKKEVSNPPVFFSSLRLVY